MNLLINMNKLVIRDLKKEDIEAIENIYALYWPDQKFRERLSSRLKDGSVACLVAENNGEVVGVSGFRKAPEHMIEFTKTNNPAELYILAVKDRQQGIGKALVEKALKDIKNLNYTEVVLYSGETHQDSWSFYDHLNFERVAPSTAPNGELGQIWRILV